MIVLGLLLDILAMKYHTYARIIIYFELVFIVIQRLTPFRNSSIGTEMLTQITYWYFIFACDPASNILACTVTITIMLMIEVLTIGSEAVGQSYRASPAY